MLKRVFLAVLASFSLASVSYADEGTVPTTPTVVRTVRLGVMSFRGQNGFTTHIDDEDRLLAQVPQWIASLVPGIQLETRYYRMNDLMRAVETKNVDVFLGSSGLFWQMKHTGARDLATIVSAQTPDPNEGVAGVIFVWKDRSDLNTLEDLKDKTASMGLDNMFLATQLAMAAIAKAGFNPRHLIPATSSRTSTTTTCRYPKPAIPACLWVTSLQNSSGTDYRRHFSSGERNR